MKKLSILILLIVFVASCCPDKKRKHDYKKHRVEHKMHDSTKMDSVKKAKWIKWREMKKAKKDSIK